MEINYVYQRLRKDFGRSAKQFADAPTTALHETIGNPDQVHDMMFVVLRCPNSDSPSSSVSFSCLNCNLWACNMCQTQANTGAHFCL
jgi:hypothetical protein